MRMRSGAVENSQFIFLGCVVGYIGIVYYCILFSNTEIFRPTFMHEWLVKWIMYVDMDKFTYGCEIFVELYTNNKSITN